MGQVPRRHVEGICGHAQVQPQAIDLCKLPNFHFGSEPETAR
jgi:hypothetical protein